MRNRKRIRLVSGYEAAGLEVVQEKARGRARDRSGNPAGFAGANPRSCSGKPGRRGAAMRQNSE
jgi:hypothetical protein